VEVPEFLDLKGKRSTLKRTNRTCPHPDSLERLLAHLARDWSEEYTYTAGKVHKPVLDLVKKFARKDGRVLVPGSGVGRLGWELSRRGYEVEMNE
jgi:carnosine N-methyltransferase